MLRRRCSLDAVELQGNGLNLGQSIEFSDLHGLVQVGEHIAKVLKSDPGQVDLWGIWVSAMIREILATRHVVALITDGTRLTRAYEEG